MGPAPGIDIAGMAGKQVAVVGLGVSNVPVVRLLAGRGAVVHAFDAKTPDLLGQRLDEVGSLLSSSHLGEDYLERLASGRYDVLVLTPGIQKDLPAIQLHRRQGAVMTSEMDLFLSLCPCRTAGVTGSAGKTTTTTLLYEMLRRGAGPVYIGGNIGSPLVEQAADMPPSGWAVLELSSFQLETCTSSPHVAVILNLFTDHLDVHPTTEAYREAKRRILRFQGPSDHAVLNYDQPRVRVLEAECRGRVSFFSLADIPPRGTYVDGGTLRWRGEGRDIAIGPVSDLLLRGRHNLANLAAAAAAALVAGATPGDIMEVARTFKTISHRLEEVAVVDGVTYVNDSIATTPERAAAALDSFDRPVIVIAGGYDKGLPLDGYGREVAGRAKAAVLIGVTAGTIGDAISRCSGDITVVHAGDLEDAVARATDLAEPGDVVLLSPACASFDMFSSYVERGNVFRQIVSSLQGSR